MKKLALVLVLVGIFSISWLSEKQEPAYLDNKLYQALSKEDWGELDTEKRLDIIIGIDYLPYEFFEIFEALTGIKVVVDIYDSNEILEAKLLAGGSRYDIVFPTAWPHFSRQLSAKIYQPIDKTKVDFSQFDSVILEKLATYDNENQFCVPYQFGISGIGLDEKVINKILPKVDKNSLEIFLNPENAKKLSEARFCLYDSPDELFPVILAYLGLNPESSEADDIIKAAEHLKKLRSYIYKFTPFGFEDLSSRNAAMVLGTSGDILKVSKDTHRPEIKFFYPKEGTALWVDVIAIPKGAKHKKNLYAFLKFLFNPQIIAAITNATSRANCVTKSRQYVDKELVKNNSIYPTAEFCRKCYIEKPMPPHIEALRTRLLTKIKSMM